MIEIDTRWICGAEVSLYWNPDAEILPLLLVVSDGDRLRLASLRADEGMDALNHPARFRAMVCNCAICRGPADDDSEHEAQRDQEMSHA